MAFPSSNDTLARPSRARRIARAIRRTVRRGAQFANRLLHLGTNNAANESEPHRPHISWPIPQEPLPTQQPPADPTEEHLEETVSLRGYENSHEGQQEGPSGQASGPAAPSSRLLPSDDSSRSRPTTMNMSADSHRSGSQRSLPFIWVVDYEQRPEAAADSRPHTPMDESGSQSDPTTIISSSDSRHSGASRRSIPFPYNDDHDEQRRRHHSLREHPITPATADGGETQSIAETDEDIETSGEALLELIEDSGEEADAPATSDHRERQSIAEETDEDVEASGEALLDLIENSGDEFNGDSSPEGDSETSGEALLRLVVEESADALLNMIEEVEERRSPEPSRPVSMQENDGNDNPSSSR